MEARGMRVLIIFLSRIQVIFSSQLMSISDAHNSLEITLYTKELTDPMHIFTHIEQVHKKLQYT